MASFWKSYFWCLATMVVRQTNMFLETVFFFFWKWLAVPKYWFFMKFILSLVISAYSQKIRIVTCIYIYFFYFILIYWLQATTYQWYIKIRKWYFKFLMILARICVVWSKSPLGTMLILIQKVMYPIFLWVYLSLDNGDPIFVLQFSNLEVHTIAFTKIRISEISHSFWEMCQS